MTDSRSCCSKVVSLLTGWLRGGKSDSDTHDVDPDRVLERRRRPLSLDMGNLTSKEAKQVAHVIREFITDELKYVDALDTIEHLFVQPLRDPSMQARLGISDAPDLVYRVFGNWSSIRELHHDLANRLLDVCTTAKPLAVSGSKVGKTFSLDPKQTLQLTPRAHRKLPQIFLEFVPFFKLYSEFLKVQDGHLSTRDADAEKTKKKKKKKKKEEEPVLPAAVLKRQSRKSPAFKQWLKAGCADARMRSLGLDTYLAKPFQRLCRYPLYLRRLQEMHAEQESAIDAERVDTAIRKLKVVIDSVNLHLHHLQASKQMAAVSRALSGKFGRSSSGSIESTNSPDASSTGAATDDVSGIIAPTKRCLAFGDLAFAPVTAGYQPSWHTVEGVRAQGLLMGNSLIIYCTSTAVARRRSSILGFVSSRRNNKRAPDSAEGIEVLHEIAINPSCRVRRILSNGTKPTRGAKAIATQPLSIGRFCVHLVAQSPGQSVQSFLLAVDNEYEQDDWFKALDSVIHPKPKAPPKTYPKGVNEVEARKSQRGRDCVIS